MRKGKEEIKRVNNLLANNSSSSSSLHRRQPLTDADTELGQNSVNEADIRASLIETQINVDELQRKAKV
jgi:hypothetical protein